MSTDKQQEWFQTRLRWAVMEEGHGLMRWREAEHIFLSDSRETAFQEALRIGRAEEYSLLPDERNEVAIDCRFAEVVSLEELGTRRTHFEVFDVWVPGPEQRFDGGDLGTALVDSCCTLPAFLGDFLKRAAVAVEGGLLACQRLPALHDHIDIFRVQLDAHAGALGQFGRRERCAAA
jgi:hypothetical protein